MSNERNGKLSDSKINHTRWMDTLCALLAFIGACVGIALYNLHAFGSLYLQSDDGDLYLSIARNLLENAHFIQTARPIEAFVVPPGLPAVTTLLLFLTGGLSEFLVGARFCSHLIGQAQADMLILLGFQYLVYGGASALMALSALRLAKNGIASVTFEAGDSEGFAEHRSPVVSTRAFDWGLSALTGLAVPAFYVWCSIQIRHPNPGFVLTENYVVFLIALLLWLLVRGTDLRAITAVSFVLLLFRPACAPLFAAALVALVASTAKDVWKREAREDVRRPVRLYNLFILLGVFACVLGFNVGVNYIETGELILLEDYAKLDVYLANNEQAQPDWYHSGKVSEFASERYREIADDASLTRYEQNAMAGEALRDYVGSNLQTVLRNAAVRYKRLFCDTWGLVFYAFCACLAPLMLLKGLKRSQKICLLFASIVLSAAPAFGLLVARYSAPMLPLFIAVIVAGAGQIAGVLAVKARRQPAAAAASAGAEKKTQGEAKVKVLPRTASNDENLAAELMEMLHPQSALQEAQKPATVEVEAAPQTATAEVQSTVVVEIGTAPQPALQEVQTPVAIEVEPKPAPSQAQEAVTVETEAAPVSRVAAPMSALPEVPTAPQKAQSTPSWMQEPLPLEGEAKPILLKIPSLQTKEPLSTLPEIELPASLFASQQSKTPSAFDALTPDEIRHLPLSELVNKLFPKDSAPKE